MNPRPSASRCVRAPEELVIEPRGRPRGLERRLEHPQTIPAATMAPSASQNADARRPPGPRRPPRQAAAARRPPTWHHLVARRRSYSGPLTATGTRPRPRSPPDASVPRRRPHAAARLARPAAARPRATSSPGSARRRRSSRCPYQLYVADPSRRFLTGLLGAAELGPLIVDGAGRRRARRPRRPPPAAAARPDRARGAAPRRCAALAFAGDPPLAAALRARRPAGGLRRDPERRALGDRAEPRRAGAAARRARAELRPLPADDGRSARRSAAC